MKKTRVLLVDDHAILRMGLASLIGTEKNLEVVGDAESGEQALQKARQLKPDIVLLDLMMHGMDGVETTRRLLEDDPDARILILTTYGTSDALGRALTAGALGAVLKSIPFRELVKAILTVASGQRYVSEEISRVLAANPPLPPLSPRQAEILTAIADGLSNVQIADKLGIGPDMVKVHVNALCTKLGAVGGMGAQPPNPQCRQQVQSQGADPTRSQYRNAPSCVQSSYAPCVSLPSQPRRRF